MGSVTIIFLAPIIILMSLFGNLIAAFTGENLTEVTLPYDESKGIVWKYDDSEEKRIFDYKETRIEGDKQIFVFEGERYSYLDQNKKHDPTLVEEAVFTAENGSKLIYYVRDDNENNSLSSLYYPVFFAPGEYYTFDYTVKPDKVRENAEWISFGGNDGFLSSTLYENDECKFNLVWLPEKKGEEIKEGDTHSVGFNYQKSSDAEGLFEQYYQIRADFKLENGKVVNTSVKRYEYVPEKQGFIEIK